LSITSKAGLLLLFDVCFIIPLPAATVPKWSICYPASASVPPMPAMSNGAMPAQFAVAPPV
jgi:hypothetical protein